MSEIQKTKKELIADVLIKLYKEYKPNSRDILVFEGDTSYSDFYNLIENPRKSDRNKFCVTEIEQINSINITPVVTSHKLIRKGIRKSIKTTEKMGCYKVTFSDNSILLYAKWLCGEGTRENYDSLYAIEAKIWPKYANIEREEICRQRRPPGKGIYRLNRDDFGDPYYAKIDELPCYPLVISNENEIIHDINYHFSNIPSALIYNRPGIRKVLFIGEPGTGKSSMCNNIAVQYCNKMPVVFTTDFWEMSYHLVVSGKYGRRNIVILEDADSSLSKADSKILNILDGSDTPKNVKGSYVIMTTNYPEKIEPRVKRAGRIDKKFSFGVLRNEYAFNCARMYFEESNLELNKLRGNGGNKDILSVFDGLTGAQIKELAYATVSYMVGSQIENFSIEVLNHVKADLIESEIKSQELRRENKLIRNKSIGFDIKAF